MCIIIVFFESLDWKVLAAVVSDSVKISNVATFENLKTLSQVVWNVCCNDCKKDCCLVLFEKPYFFLFGSF